MYRKDVVSIVAEHIERAKKIPSLCLAHVIIDNNLLLSFEVDKEFKISRYKIDGNMSTLQEGSLLLIAKKIERIRELVNKFNNDQIEIDDFNVMMKTLIKVTGEEVK